MSQSNDENVNPYTIEIYELISRDLRTHSNHFLMIDAIVVDKIDKIWLFLFRVDLFTYTD